MDFAVPEIWYGKVPAELTPTLTSKKKKKKRTRTRKKGPFACSS
jgi:hypothetical protein